MPSEPQKPHDAADGAAARALAAEKIAEKPGGSDVFEDGEIDRATDPEYAAISTLAVVGLIAALAGAFAFRTLPMVALAVLGFGLGLAGLRQIRRSEGVLTGRRIALAAIAVGAAVTVSATAYHAYYWQRNRAFYGEIEKSAFEVADEIVAGHYEKVYEMMPENFRRREAAGPAHFRSQIAPLFTRTGKLIGRSLLSLQVVDTQDFGLAAPAQVHLEFERRYVDLTIIFARSAEGRWELAGVGGAETFESMTKFPAPEGTQGPGPGMPQSIPPSHPKGP